MGKCTLNPLYAVPIWRLATVRWLPLGMARGGPLDRRRVASAPRDAAWLCRADQDVRLAAFFKPNLTPSERPWLRSRDGYWAWRNDPLGGAD
jgi:hypothetical protein